MSRILLSGSSGFLGSHLKEYLSSKGYEVIPLVRSAQEKGIHFPSDKEEMQLSELENAHAIIHLAGERITGRWTEKKKEKIYSSRIDSTKKLSNAIRKLKNPPKMFLTASAIGLYGDRDDEWLTEESSVGNGFLASVTKDWEEAAQDVPTNSIQLRSSMILGKDGALKVMLPAFRLGLGGKMGTGQQFISWMHITDWVRAVHFLMEKEAKGAFNLCTRMPVRQVEFAKTLGKVLHRPTWLPMPVFLMRILFGEMAKEVLLASTRAKPEKLLQMGFSFRYDRLQEAFEDVV